MTRIYISGPMTGLPEHNFPAFREAAAQLRAAGYEVEDPSEKGVIEGWSWEQYLKYDLTKMFECDGVATLEGYSFSKGARLETDTAKRLNMRVTFLQRWLDEASMQEAA